MAKPKTPYKKMEYQAIQAYAHTINARLALCRGGICHFYDRKTNREITATLQTIVRLYKIRQNTVKGL